MIAFYDQVHTRFQGIAMNSNFGASGAHSLSIRGLLAIACLSLVLSACSSDSGGDGQSTAGSGAADNGSTEAGGTVAGSTTSDASTEAGNTDAASTDAGAAFEPSPFSGPALFQTGSVPVSRVREFTDDRKTVVIDFEVDSEANRVGNNMEEFKLPGFYYDDAGRVTAFEGLSTTGPWGRVEYNENGSIHTVFFDNGDESVTYRFNYEKGRLVSTTNTVYCCGKTDLIVQVNYVYDADGTLLSATKVKPGTNEVEPAGGYQFTLNNENRISEVLENVADSGEFEQRHLLTYDNAGNITKHEIYNSDGSLDSTTITTYVDSPELVPNVMGFIAARNSAFVPVHTER